MLRDPYGFGTGSATTAGCPFSAGRYGASATYSACRVNGSPVMIGSNAAFTHDWISGTLRKLVVSFTSFAPQSSRRLHTSR
jgi:hypothetical protein